MNTETLEAAERATRVALDVAVENLAAARRAVPPFTPVADEYYDALDAARGAWHRAYDALSAASY